MIATLAMTVRRSEVEAYLADFLAGAGGDWEWDDFISSPIDDPMLDEIRIAAAAVPLPLTDQGRDTLHKLLEQVRSE